MATNYWVGGAPAVKQVGTVMVTAGDATTTYKLTIGGQTISFTGNSNTTTIAAGLVTAWSTSTHPYFTAVVITNNTNIITITAATAGVPFTLTSSVSGGAGTIGAYTSTTASSGPNDWSTAANWSTGVVPASGDDVYFANGSWQILWGLNQSGVTGVNSLNISKSFTGKLGLDWTNFATAADGTAVSQTQVNDYRPTYLQMGITTVNIGENYSPITPAGAQRICIDLGSVTASTVNIYNTASSASESGRPCVRLKAANAGTNILVRSAPGGVGVAMDVPGETSTVASVQCSDTTTTSRVFVGSGVTITTFVQEGGNNVLKAANTPTTVTVNGGVLASEGTCPIATVNMNGGTFTSNSSGTITTFNAKGGTTDFTQNNKSRTVTTLNLNSGAKIKADGSILTITTLVQPTGQYSMQL